MHFAALPDHRAGQHPDGPALADPHNGGLTNAELLTRVRTAAARLAKAGVSAGDVVAVMLPNRVELIIALFAAWRLGAAATPINPALTPAEVDYQLADSSARVLVREDDPELPDPAVGIVTRAELSEPTPETAETHDYSGDDLALLVYTSGTTGRPKGVELTHANILAMAQSMLASMDLGADAHSLLILPLFHVNGIVVGVLTPLLAGGQATVAGRFSPSSFFGIVEDVRPTYFSAVPAIYAMLAALPADVAPDTSSVRFAICGAAPMPVGLIADFEQRYGIPIIEGYGLSEGTCASTSNPIDGIRKPGTVGVALPGQRVAIMNGRGELITDGSVGEVVVNGPTVMRGYLNRPEDTANTVVDGWLRTGDIGFLDSDGYLTLVDRAKDMIIRGGENIYPAEIEAFLFTHPRIAEASVVGLPDLKMGEIVAAWVRPKPGPTLTAEEVRDYCKGKIAHFKIPQHVRIVESLPMTVSGKIQKFRIREIEIEALGLRDQIATTA